MQHEKVLRGVCAGYLLQRDDAAGVELSELGQIVDAAGNDEPHVVSRGVARDLRPSENLQHCC